MAEEGEEDAMRSPIRAKVYRFVMACAVTLVTTIALIAAATFPYDVDRPLSAEELEKNRNYYADAYRKSTPTEDQPNSDYETKYVREAARAAKDAHVKEWVSGFASMYGLQDRAILDVGSGRGYLQDVVGNYTGLDISSNVARFYHKKFVLGSATAMPFRDNSFDGGWSIWVLEHVPNPEQALLEIRRVMKNNAVFYLRPAWLCTSWAAEGYDVRPYSDFDWKGRLIKASIPVRTSLPFRFIELVSNRELRNLAAGFGPTRLHYRLLQPNYKDYWGPDSDAVNRIDRSEAMLWFRSRGDECLNCDSPWWGLPALVIRIHKQDVP